MSEAALIWKVAPVALRLMPRHVTNPVQEKGRSHDVYSA
jgi:hypothetical protein